ncbi:MAG: hypothetical protein ACR2NU_04370 [Aeoliella sp.]
MESEKQQDQWADLLGNLDIEAKEEEPQQPPKPEPQLPETEQTKSQPPVARSPPQQPTSDWGSLASDLGLEIQEPASLGTPPATPPQRPTSRRETTKRDPAPDRDNPQVDQQRPTEAKQRPTETKRTAERAEPPIVPPNIKPAHEPAAETPAPTAEKPTAEKPTADKPPTEKPNASAGFGAGTLTLPDWFPFGGKKKLKPLESPSEAVETDSNDTVKVTDDVAAAPADKETTTEEGRPRGKRRRGRRRGGRGRSRGAAGTPSVDGSGKEQPAGQGDSGEDSRMDTVEAGGVHTGDESLDVARTQTISHKSIPSWQEAIGVVVDGNIAARGERKRAHRGSGGSRGGSSRGGRSRGRRKKKES